MIEHTPCANRDTPCRIYAVQNICNAAHVSVLDLSSINVYVHGIKYSFLVLVASPGASHAHPVRNYTDSFVSHILVETGFDTNIACSHLRIYINKNL